MNTDRADTDRNNTVDAGPDDTDADRTDGDDTDFDGTDFGDADRDQVARRVPFAVLILALLAGGMCALLALNTVTAASEVQQRQVDASNATYDNEQQQLSRDVANLQSPQELARKAAKLGLVPADSPAFLKINADGSVTVLGSPAPASTQPPATTPTPTVPVPTPAPTTPAAATPGAPVVPTTPDPNATPTPNATPIPTPAPTQTPTPTITLPGGPR